MDRLEDPLQSTLEPQGLPKSSTHSYLASPEKDQGSNPSVASQVAQLVLKDWSLQDIKYQDQEVLKKKFARAVAHATQVSSEKVRVIGFEEGSIKVRLEIIDD